MKYIHITKTFKIIKNKLWLLRLVLDECFLRQDLDEDIKWHLKGFDANLRHRELIGKINCFRYIYMDISTMTQDELYEFRNGKREDPLHILQFHFDSVIYECNILQINCLSSGYIGALRSSRWLIEASLGAFSAIVSPRTINDKITSSSMTMDDYIACLEEYDRNNRSFPRTDILPHIGLSNIEEYRIDCLYHTLSKQIHYSPDTFLRPVKVNFHSRLQYDPKQLEQTFEQILQVFDFCLYVDLKTLWEVLKYDKETLSSIQNIPRDYFHISNKEDSKKQLLFSQHDLPLTWEWLEQQNKSP